MSQMKSPLSHPLPVLPAVALLLAALLAGSPAARADVELFIDSSDYREDDEITGVFLTDEHYRVMVEDIERRGKSLDWGWVLTPGGSPDSPSPEEPNELGFDVSDYATVHVPEVENFAGIVKEEELAEIREAFVLAAEQLGWTVVDEGAGAELELEVAIVDVNREGGGFAIFRVDPFIEMEIQLRDVGGDRDLLLARHQKHAENPEGSALETANILVQFLR